MKRFAFTMLELIFVIIVIGILAVLAMPNFKTDPLKQAAEQIAGHIRYTQHLAMIDDKYNDKNATWWQGRWTIDLCGTQYRVALSNDTVTAIDPLTHTNINGAISKDFDLNAKYNIATINVPDGKCRIIFDNMGRPFASAGIPTSEYDEILVNNSVFTLTHEGKTATVTIHPETGYVDVNYTMP